MVTVKKFGKHTYDLWANARNQTSANKEAKKAKEAGFARVRYTVTSGYPQSTNLYWIWVDVKSLKDAEQPAYHKGGVVHTRRIK